MKSSGVSVAAAVLALVLGIAVTIGATAFAATPTGGVTSANDPLSPLVLIGIALAGIGFLLLIGRPIRHS
jgi:hypothetical protein